MSSDQYTPNSNDINQDSPINTSTNPYGSINNRNNESKSSDMEKSREKSKRIKKDENVLYLTVEDENEPIHIHVKRVVPKIIDEYVKNYGKPIRRNKLQELVFGYDERLAKFYEESKEDAVAVFSFALSKLFREKKVVKVKDPDKRKATYYILPEHVEGFRRGSGS